MNNYTNIHHLNVADAAGWVKTLHAGDAVRLSGTVYTARDAAHKRIFQLLDDGAPPPFPLDGAFIYYAGPTPAPDGRIIGSCGPTTSSRMDKFTPRLLSLGLLGMIGKGTRSDVVRRAICETGSVYLCAVGGAGALASEHIAECEVVAFPELGCESVKRLVFRDFPLFVGYDAHGGSIFRG